MKTMFIIPGFKESAKSKKYSVLKEFFIEKGFQVRLVPIIWDYKTMADYILQFEDFYNKHKSDSNSVLGFSYGAVVAFSTAQKLGVDRLFLCSLSPDFSEDVPTLSQWIKKYIGSRRVADSLSRSGRELAKNLSIPTVILYGEKEAAAFPQIVVRAEETRRLAKNAQIVVVADAPHDISFPGYTAAIKNVLAVV